MSSKHVVVTGGYGLIGSAIADIFNSAGCKVTIINRNINNESKNKYNFVKADISNEDSVNNVVQEIKTCDVLVHAAASLYQDMSAITSNIHGSWNIFNAALKIKCRNVIYISSIPVIGKPETIPIDENHAVSPKTLYHLTKYTGEQILNLPDFHELGSIILRIPAPLGPKISPKKIVPVVIDACLQNNPVKLIGKGGRIQNYINVRDIAQSVLLATEYLEKQVCKGEMFLIAGHSISNIELAKTCISLLGSSSEIIFDEKLDPEEEYRWIINGEKAKEMLGFQPKISIEESIFEIAQELKGRV
ncbi:UDP-glucose 4-epimerase [Spirochaetia bacterium]|nr:UDP-glucose 4-epimerase [Spirochaetia bacterium]